jgi:Transglycosylase-like domain
MAVTAMHEPVSRQSVLLSSYTLQAGHRLHLPGRPARIHVHAAVHAARAKPAESSSTTPSTAVTGTAATSTAGTAVSTAGYGSFQACVIERESGGNPQAMNGAGDYGLYQFSYSTWAAYGGDPADFGHASVAEQNQVFATAMADGGEDNWAPYDGC